ncbi:PTB domain-containing adapter protein ced-6-like isoform X1 [Anopheles bellator]|uniref:PTB domain-containing adapter protein ced-6-like isoform X1 n=1 Tax=Anopheles bellator TaxID=139047 RepID=UPI002647F4CF|nr:PTB domain-containing adapter protein ced-6-like isoform X1 [Anopheles bellator]
MASTLMFWNKQNSSSGQNGSSDAKNTKNGRNWLHAPDVLVNGHVAYLVKYLGSTPVEQPKGIEVVKEAIRRLQFTQQMKKAEGGGNVKTKKVEITVSVDGVAIQEPRSQTIMHQFPLHKISYCADEKGVKKFFSFIAKTSCNSSAPSTVSSISSVGDDTMSGSTNSNGTSSNGSSEDRHECFVFISNKLASDITLTIGQAFDLAYRRYVSDSGKSLEATKLLAQKKQLEHTITAYRQRLKDLSELVLKADLEKLLLRLGVRDICEVPPAENGVDGHTTHNGSNMNNNNNTVNGRKTPDLGIDVSLPNNDDQLLIETSPKHFAPIVPPRNIQNQINSTLEAFKPSVGTKLEGLLLNSDSDSDFDPRAPDNDDGSMTASTAGTMGGGNKISNDLFGFEPPKPSNAATLGQQLFGSSNGHSATNGFTNGTNGASVTNGFGQAPTSPPPILAPPPAKSAPRRTAAPLTNGNGTSGAYQDLFGSAPFNPQSNDDSAFVEDASFNSGACMGDSTYAINANASGSFSDEVRVLANNSHKLDTILAHGPEDLGGVGAGVGAGATTHLTSKLNPFAAAIGGGTAIGAVLRAGNPLTAVQHHPVTAYDVFKNPNDRERLTNGTVPQVVTSGGCTGAINDHANGTTNTHGTGIIPSLAGAGVSHDPLTSEARFEDFAQTAFNEFKRDLSVNTRPVPRGRSSIGTIKPPLVTVPSITNTGGAVEGAYRLASGPMVLQPDTKTSKNGFFSSDDVLDTFDPLKK